MSSGMKVEEVLALDVTFDLRTLGKALKFGDTKMRELVRTGECPITVLKLGNQYRFRRSDLLAYLGIDEAQHHAGGDAA
ncbi:excisionase family DNA binding protein [Nocardiopsis sp. Huas11]|uniref:helix-turn-helix domain-containing protein n=1 Tax=Nocardiopsis sp. Huas11 TaxID=2183912 RepID=UPI000F287F82|nr:helix-turn-helix domain-containing protein [Nocardiopsis sp. Huas11]RKS10043.1 excisionase family DNA binding protein [Nocardiopsis sp. Huas11]